MTLHSTIRRGYYQAPISIQIYLKIKMRKDEGRTDGVTQNPVFNMQGATINNMVTSTTFTGSMTAPSLPPLAPSGLPMVPPSPGPLPPTSAKGGDRVTMGPVGVGGSTGRCHPMAAASSVPFAKFSKAGVHGKEAVEEAKVSCVSKGKSFGANVDSLRGPREGSDALYAEGKTRQHIACASQTEDACGPSTAQLAGDAAQRGSVIHFRMS
eukprot:TRINITY_DN456_c0_g1_i12.p2 TRINITY_DN456_c0_g1~~TRINITY_DN456_c0_g1_i12.p2  ORF type:complete len:210 (+),score=0.07 TRINITY_DN456_c0_g1_i12:1266-1895(+)